MPKVRAKPSNEPAQSSEQINAEPRHIVENQTGDGIRRELHNHVDNF
jgi:hypothetical protein